MYLKRRTSSQVFMLLLFVAFVGVVWHFMPKDEHKQDFMSEYKFSESLFKGKVEEIIAPKSGIKAYYMFQQGGLTAMSFIFTKSGSAYEKTGQEGVAKIAANTLKEGAGWWSAKELRNLMGSAGIKIGFAASKDDFSGQITFPNNKREEAVKYLREMLINPHFEDKYVEASKANTIRAIEAQKEDPYSELDLAFNNAVFGEFPYGRNPLGTIDSVSAVNRRSLIDFVHNHLTKNNLFIGIVGNISKDDAALMIDDAFAKLPLRDDEDIGSVSINWQQPDLNIKRNIPQNIIMYAAKGTCRKCDDFYPLYIANYILGGAGLNSRLNQQMREKENLTYGVSSWLELNDKADLLAASFAATTDNIAKAKKMFAQLWQDAGSKGFSAEELQNAKDHLIASHNLRFASTVGISDMLAYMQKYDLGIDFLNRRNRLVNNVTLQQLNQAAQKYFNNNIIKAEIGNINK